MNFFTQPNLNLTDYPFGIENGEYYIYMKAIVDLTC
jgi:hypothetical protein